MKQENPTIEICPGITRRTVANGKTMYQMMATLAAGSRMPPHSHPQEQLVHILEGKMRLIVDGVPHELSTGDSFYLASNIPHGVEVILPTRVLDTFSPPRDEYVVIDKKVRQGALYLARWEQLLKNLLPHIDKDLPPLYALQFRMPFWNQGSF